MQNRVTNGVQAEVTGGGLLPQIFKVAHLVGSFPFTSPPPAPSFLECRHDLSCPGHPAARGEPEVKASGSDRGKQKAGIMERHGLSWGPLGFFK